MKTVKTILKLCLITLLALQFSCRKDFSSETSNGNLSFSTDTLYLDTVFNNLTTTTHSIKVYNKTNNDVSVPIIKLEKEDSKYRLNIDGMPGTEFEDVLIREKDSIFIHIEATISSTDTEEMLYEDKIIFDPNGITQSVQLVSLVQDAHLLFPKENETEFNITQSTFTNEKPYVIYGKANVSENASLSIEPGSTIYFNENASLNIAKGATLLVNGTLSDSIVFKGDNLNYAYDNVTGQWQGLTIEENSNVQLEYLKILNATTGITVTENTNNIHIKNTEIYNVSNYGIQTSNANITAENLVIGGCLNGALNLQGGDYNFSHCTLANYWPHGFRTNSNVTLSNFYFNEEEQETTSPLNSANFINCIIAGSNNIENEINFEQSENESIFNFSFKNCMLQLEEDGEDLLDITNSLFYSNNLYNKELYFYNASENDLRIGLSNEGINAADTNTANTIPLDITGVNRTTNPDIGAYQHIDFETLNTEEEENE